MMQPPQNSMYISDDILPNSELWDIVSHVYLNLNLICIVETDPPTILLTC